MKCKRYLCINLLIHFFAVQLCRLQRMSFNILVFKPCVFGSKRKLIGQSIRKTLLIHLCQRAQQKTKVFRRLNIMMFLLHIFGNESNIDMK